MAVMGTNTGLVLLALFLCNFNYCTAFRLKFTNMICESFNNSWVTYKECRLRAISRNKTTLNAVVFITEPAYDISVRLQVLKKANGYKPWVMDYTVDCCKFMRQQYHPVGKIVWTLIKDFSSFNHTCPYVGLHWVKNFYDVDRLPIMFPTGEYLMNFTWMFNKKPQFGTKVFYSFTED